MDIDCKKEQFREAIKSAFPDLKELRLLLNDNSLGYYMDKINTTEGYIYVLDYLITQVEGDGNTLTFLDILLKAKPNNQKLSKFGCQYLFDSISNKEYQKNEERLDSLLLEIQDFKLLVESCLESLPKDVEVHCPEDINNIKDHNFNSIYRLFCIFNLLINKYPHINNQPTLFIFARKVFQKISSDDKNRISDQLKEWINKVYGNSSIGREQRPPVSNTRLDAYLIITVKKLQASRNKNEFYFNAYLEWPPQISPNIDPIYLPDQQNQKGVKVNLKNTGNQQASKIISDYLDKCVTEIVKKQKKYSYNTFNLTLEFFMEHEYLDKEIDHLTIEIKNLKRSVFIGQRYQLVVRSYERLLNHELWNDLTKFWGRINRKENTEFVVLQNINAFDIKKILKKSIGILVSSLPDSNKDFFQQIVLTGIPIAIWIRNNEINNNVLHDFLETFANQYKFLEEIKNTRDDYNLGILYESNRWDDSDIDIRDQLINSLTE